jgi:hypothetical protein
MPIDAKAEIKTEKPGRPHIAVLGRTWLKNGSVRSG